MNSESERGNSHERGNLRSVMGYLHACDVDVSEDRDLLIAMAIYELGLKLSSPKLLLEFMPNIQELNSEHLKSHLQKYRIHQERSLGEFTSFYNDYIKDKLENWEKRKSEPNDESDGENNDGDSDAKNTASAKRNIEEQIMIAKRRRMEDQTVNQCCDIIEDMNKEFMNNLGNILETITERNADEKKKSDESCEQVVNDAACSTKNDDSDKIHRNEWSNDAACSTENDDSDKIHRNEWNDEGGSNSQDVYPLDFEVDSDLDVHMS